MSANERPESFEEVMFESDVVLPDPQDDEAFELILPDEEYVAPKDEIIDLVLAPVEVNEVNVNDIYPRGWEYL